MKRKLIETNFRLGIHSCKQKLNHLTTNFTIYNLQIHLLLSNVFFYLIRQVMYCADLRLLILFYLSISELKFEIADLKSEKAYFQSRCYNIENIHSEQPSTSKVISIFFLLLYVFLSFI